MKNICALLLILITSCSQNPGQQQASSSDSSATITKTTGDTPSATARTGSELAPVPANRLIVPGKSIGLTAIGQTAEETGKNLGRPDDGDAAMGKSLSTWYSKINPAYKTQVFSAMQMGNEETMPRVKSIRVNNPFFETAGQLKAGSNLKEILAKFPSLLLTGSYKSADNHTIKLYDDSEAGIAFEMDDKDICVGINVHIIGEKAFVQYLPFESSFKTIEN